MTRAITIMICMIMMAGCGTNSQPTVPQVSTGPTAQDADRWAESWCEVGLRSTRQAVERVMGTPPTEAITPDVSTWEGMGYQFNVFFGEDDRVRQLDVIDIQMTARQKAKISCPTLRK